MKPQEPIYEDKSASVAPVYEKESGVQTSYSDPEFGSGDADKVETTKRGLKARHAQMIALGGTIGSFSQSTF
jgi:amino acid transporter